MRMACKKNHGYGIKVDAEMVLLVFEDVSSTLRSFFNPGQLSLVN